MNDILTPEQVQEARRLCKHATPGPWEAFAGEHGRTRRYWDVLARSDETDICVCALADLRDDPQNAEFISAARTLLPQALDTIDALRAALARAEAEVAHWKICSLCGEQMEAPGHCGVADREIEEGWRMAAEDAYKQRDAAVARAEAALAVLRAWSPANQNVIDGDIAASINDLRQALMTEQGNVLDAVAPAEE